LVGLNLVECFLSIVICCSHYNSHSEAIAGSCAFIHFRVEHKIHRKISRNFFLGVEPSCAATAV
jgi:hypothetical protein